MYIENFSRVEEDVSSDVAEVIIHRSPAASDNSAADSVLLVTLT